MNVLEREYIEGGLTELLTNEYDMNKITVIKDGIVDSNYIRVVSHDKYDWDFIGDCSIMRNRTYKLQIKIHGFLTSKYHTIKKWEVDVDDAAEDELAKNEAVELLNNIINPYKNGNV